MTGCRKVCRIHTPGTSRSVIVVALLDDVDLGAPSTFGGLIETSVLEQLTKGGLRYTQLHYKL